MGSTFVKDRFEDGRFTILIHSVDIRSLLNKELKAFEVSWTSPFLAEVMKRGILRRVWYVDFDTIKLGEEDEKEHSRNSV